LPLPPPSPLLRCEAVIAGTAAACTCAASVAASYGTQNDRSACTAKGSARSQNSSASCFLLLLLVVVVGQEPLAAAFPVCLQHKVIPAVFAAAASAQFR
jgi:hypothetical protein